MTHTEILNYLIQKFNLNSYLEIGLDNAQNFMQIQCANKESVDPFFSYSNGTNGDSVFLENGNLPEIIKQNLTYRMTSDELFSSLPKEKKYDLIFIDGLHTEEQVRKDIVNSLNHLNLNGFILLHDCLPSREECQIVPRICQEWNGDVWKALPQLNNYGIKYQVIDTDYGCGIIKKDKSTPQLDFIEPSSLAYYDVFSSQSTRNTIMHVISEEEFKNLYK